ncbi:MAG: hypothetical protein HYY15_00745 [Candidatus Omnitrophica bacterium]|nr:hypothetical protein [Candidatus Omnitrophota bacterium]
MTRLAWSRRGAAIVFAAIAVFWAARWAMFPLVLDPYYHLLVAQQTAAAGGPVAYEWWEYAPAGRPHLYPPLLHILLAFGLKLGLSDLTVLRMASVALVPALVWTMARFARRVAGERAALLTLCVAVMPFVFPLHAAVTLAATLGLIELLWYVRALQEGRAGAAAGVLGLLWYTHLGLPWIALAATCLYGWARPEIRRQAARVIGWSSLLAAPWWLHLAAHRSWLHSVARLENERIDIVLPVLALALAGAARSWKDARTGRLLVCCWGAFALYGMTYWYRWWNGEGLMPALVLAGIGAWRAGEWWNRRRPRVPAGAVQAACVLACLVSPTLVIGAPSAASASRAQEWRWQWMDSGWFHLAGWPRTVPKPLEASLVTRETEQLAAVVEEVSRPGDIIWSNADYAGGLIVALAHRAMSSAMFSEVASAATSDPVAAAHWVVWFRELDAQDRQRLAALIARYGLVLAQETKLALVLRHPGGGRPAQAPRAVIPLWVSGVLLCVVLGAVIWDFHRPNCHGVY